MRNVTDIIENAMAGFSAHASNYGQVLAAQERKRNIQRLNSQGYSIRIVRVPEGGKRYRVLINANGYIVKVLNRVK